MDENMNYSQTNIEDDVQEYDYGPADGGQSYTQGTPVYEAPKSEPSESNAFAIAGMVCGIVAVVMVCCFFPIAFICGIAGIVLSIIALNKKQSKGMAIAGIVTSAVAFLLAIFVVIVAVIFSSSVISEMGTNVMENGNYDEYYYNELYEEIYDEVYDMPMDDVF